VDLPAYLFDSIEKTDLGLRCSSIVCRGSMPVDLTACLFDIIEISDLDLRCAGGVCSKSTSLLV
jgi:hypothetical protein